LSENGRLAVTAENWAEGEPPHPHGKLWIDSLGEKTPARAIALDHHVWHPRLTADGGQVRAFCWKDTTPADVTWEVGKGERVGEPVLGPQCMIIFHDATGRRAVAVLKNFLIRLFDYEAGEAAGDIGVVPGTWYCVLSNDGKVMAARTATELRLYRTNVRAGKSP
jgi:hypothetical protein